MSDAAKTLIQFAILESRYCDRHSRVQMPFCY